MLVGKYLFVDELFHLVDIYQGSAQGVDSSVFPMAYDSQKKVIRGNSVAAGPHRFFS